MSGLLYLILALTINGYFFYQTVLLSIKKSSHAAFKLFKLSILQIFVIFIALLMDRYFMPLIFNNLA